MKDNDIREVTRVGVYGVVMDEGDMLLVCQAKGPYAGKFDFPGGGIEFGESPERALRREFEEEIGMEFDFLKLLDNFTTTVEVPQSAFKEPYLFFQIGMIYKVEGCRLSKQQKNYEFEPVWKDPKILLKDHCSNLLWEYVQNCLQQEKK